MIGPDQEVALRAIPDTFRSEGAWPVLQPLDALLAGKGIPDPTRCLMSMPAGMIKLDTPISDGSRVRLTVAGLYEIERAAPELALFTTALRGAVDIYTVHPFGSLTQTQQVVADALELVPRNGGFTHAQLVVLGLLFEVEEIGRLEWVDGPSPWRITITRTIRRYRGVGHIKDYLDL